MIYLEEILKTAPLTGARLIGSPKSRSFDGFSHDSRKLRPGELFVAIRTAKADGHDFLQEAVDRGAAGLLIDKEPATIFPLSLDEASREKVTIIKVDDTSDAILEWAKDRLASYSPQIIAIVGSRGKSTLQKALVAVLGQGYLGGPTVFDSDGYKTPIGLPVSIGRLSPEHRIAILELGAGNHEEASRFARLIQPGVAIFTDFEASYLTEYLEWVGSDTLLVANYDSPGFIALGLAPRTRPITYSARGDSRADLWASDVRVGPEGTTLIAHASESIARLYSIRAPVEISLRLLGRHFAETALAALAVGIVQGISSDEIAQGLSSLAPLPGRLSPLSSKDGSLVLDDSLTTDGPSLLFALETLRSLAGRRAGRRVAVLGEVFSALEEAELEAAYRAVLASTDYLFLKGDTAPEAEADLVGRGYPRDRLFALHSSADTLAALAGLGLSEEDIVLVKGHEDSRMEMVVQGLLEKPEEAPNLLVRQDEGWKQRVFLSRERPTWVEIDLGAIGHNVSRVKEIVGPNVEVMAVLKADAYGHGALRVARTALLHGASQIATACLSEAIAIRRHGIVAPILILGYTPPWQAAEIVRWGAQATVFSREVAEYISRAAMLAGASPVPVHVKVDTGMGRLGLDPKDAPDFVEAIGKLPGIEIRGIFTHFAMADYHDKAHALSQLERFNWVLTRLAERGIEVRYVHAANSAATLSLPQSRFNLVRLGIAMHGLDPSSEVRCPEDFKSALSFKTQIAQVKSFPVGVCVSYGCRFTTSRPSKIAVIPVGYGDGFRRSPASWGEVLVRGKRAPIVGTVCMDMSMIDVTDIPGVHPGNEVVLIGSQGEDRLTVEDVASRLGTINYEVVTQLLSRVPREVSPSS